MATPSRYLATCRMTPPTGGEPVQVDAVWATFCSREYEQGCKYCAAGEPVWADPPDASTALKNNVRAKIVLISRGNVDWITKAKYAEAAGAIGIMFVNSEDVLDPLPVAGPGQRANIPCVMIKKNALNNKQLYARNYGSGAIPSHSNPDGPSFCMILPATMGLSGQIDFDALLTWPSDSYSDREFPPDSSSIFINPRSPMPELAGRRIIWKRPEGVSSKPEMFPDKSKDGSHFRINQGSVDINTSFLSAVALVVSARGPINLQKLFVKTDSFNQGLLGVRFFKNGCWWDVAIDTLIPCFDTNLPCFARLEEPDMFWLTFLEKAYAKVHGCYEAMNNGCIDESLMDLTGRSPGRVLISDLVLACSQGSQVSSTSAFSALHLLPDSACGSIIQGALTKSGFDERHGEGNCRACVYLIIGACKSSAGDTLVQLRNPWCGQGRAATLNKENPRWTPELEAELAQNHMENGGDWMFIEDFLVSFAEITFVDLLPSSICILRAESEWRKGSAGGCGMYPTWCDNPQLFMKVTRPTCITFSLSQPDTRMQSKKMGKAAFEQLFVKSGGYEEHIGFTIWKGSRRKAKCSSRDALANVQHTRSRHVTTMVRECQPGCYVIVPSTYHPRQMKFRMNFWSDHPIELWDTAGGKDWQIFDASDNSLDKQNVPLITRVEVAATDEEQAAYLDVFGGMEDGACASKKSRAHYTQCSGMLEGALQGSKKAVWKIGELIPPTWQNDGTNWVMSTTATVTFFENEIVVLRHTDGRFRFAKVTKGLPVEAGKNEYEVAVSYHEAGSVRKTVLPAQAETNSYEVEYLGKLPYIHGVPSALWQQVEQIVDMVVMDTGTLKVLPKSTQFLRAFNERLLVEMAVDQAYYQQTLAAMGKLAENVEGQAFTQDQRQKLVTWMAECCVRCA